MNLNQVTLPSLDLTVSIPFYETLGLRLIVHAPPHYARFECPDGEATFSLHQVTALPIGESSWIYFECEHLDQKVHQLLEAGISFDLLPTEQTWRWREARLRDPDGNRLILFWAGKNRKNPPWRLDDVV